MAWDREIGGTGGTPPPGEAQIYRVYFPEHMLQIWFLVEGCLGGASNKTNLWVHFVHLHTQYTIVILEEGNQPYPSCPKCDILYHTRPSTDGTSRRNFAIGRGEEAASPEGG